MAFPRSPLQVFHFSLSLLCSGAILHGAVFPDQAEGDMESAPLVANGLSGLPTDLKLTQPVDIVMSPAKKMVIAERVGNIKLFNPDSGQLDLIAQIPTYTNDENGLLSIAFSPQTNIFIYISRSMPATYLDRLGKKLGKMTVSRFRWEEKALDLATEETIIEIETQREHGCHLGGSLAFNAKGSLFISTGDNTSPFDGAGYAPVDERPNREFFDAQRTAANSLSLMGKILRIKPAAVGRGYTVDRGNLRDTLPMAAPEVFAMGVRNPFKLTVNKRTGWIYWGDIGPDAEKDDARFGPAGFEEINGTQTAGFFGWPYFLADNRAYLITKGDIRQKMSAGAPRNASPNNTGARLLPPARGASFYYPRVNSSKWPAVNPAQGSCIMVGPVYHFQKDKLKMGCLPERFDNHLFALDWMRSIIFTLKLGKDGDFPSPNEKIAVQPFCRSMIFKQPIDLEFDDNGRLYVLEWGSGWGTSPLSSLRRVQSRDASD
jgi:cytochrome c